jgi:hypothetical protein
MKLGEESVPDDQLVAWPTVMEATIFTQCPGRFSCGATSLKCPSPEASGALSTVQPYDLTAQRPREFAYFLFVLSRFDIAILFVLNRSMAAGLPRGAAGD